LARLRIPARLDDVSSAAFVIVGGGVGGQVEIRGDDAERAGECLAGVTLEHSDAER
jgi:hypothetical protein